MTVEMTLGDTPDLWCCQVAQNLEGYYYTLQICHDGQWLPESIDLYAKAAGTNGVRGQVVDLSRTDPPGWDDDVKPPFEQPTDAIIYEVHLRDISMDPNSGIAHPGKYLGLTESGTRTPSGLTTGLDHLVELGVTHVHLLPIFDFLSVDESPDAPPDQYNWGYDPANYNLPEGSYATEAGDGRVRIRELKQMIQALHARGIRVIMDVVYNHTGGSVEDSCLQRLVPNVFYRFQEGEEPSLSSLSNASGCGNETASEHPLVRRYIVDSVLYWAKEYHFDGFRFDLMGIHDIDTMNALSDALHQLDPSLLIYGEGWTADDCPLPAEQRALKNNTRKLRGIAAFSDDIRDAIKGSAFDHEERGFVSGGPGKEEALRRGLVASTIHPQIDEESTWADEPMQSVSYADCHDDHCLWDRLALSNESATEEELIRMQQLALAIVLTSQGMVFLFAGSEMCRTKQGVGNTYNRGDDLNALLYENKSIHHTTYEYVRTLIALRKQHPAFRMQSSDTIRKCLQFIIQPYELELQATEEHEEPEEEPSVKQPEPTEPNSTNVVSYRIRDAPGDEWNDIVVVYHGGAVPYMFALPEGSWTRAMQGTNVEDSVASGTIALPPQSMSLFYRA